MCVFVFVCAFGTPVCEVHMFRCMRVRVYVMQINTRVSTSSLTGFLVFQIRICPTGEDSRFEGGAPPAILTRWHWILQILHNALL
jgi:hypothetical protein